jgi:hypothetical protein
MARLKSTRYTLVQHSAWVARQDPRFERQVEEAGITTEAELGRVQNLGGLVFDSYMEADDAVDEVNLLGASDPGRVAFNDGMQIRGLALYIPVT